MNSSLIMLRNIMLYWVVICMVVLVWLGFLVLRFCLISVVFVLVSFYVGMSVKMIM